MVIWDSGTRYTHDGEEAETFTVTLSSPNGATLSGASGTGTIADDGDTTTTDPVDPVDTTELELSSLAVTGGGTMYPPFDADTVHYALTCNNSPTLSVAAETGRDGAQLTQAEYRREYKLAATHGYFPYRGGVHVLEDFGGSVHWLISWGGSATGRTVALDKTIAVSEVNPVSGTAHLEMNMRTASEDAWTYRAYRIPESEVDIPLNLP